MEKPKIFVFTTSYYPFIGGAEIAIEEAAKRLNSRFDFYILTSRFRKDLPKTEERSEGTVMRLGFGSRWDKWLLPVLCLTRPGLVRLLKDPNLVIWGVDIGQGSFTAALVKLLRPQMPFILTIQYGHSDERLSSGRLGFTALAFRFMLRRADYITAISSYLLGLARRYGYRGPAEVIPNGVDIAKFQISNPQPQIIKPKTIVTTSRLVQKNAVDILVKAVAEVKKTIPNVECWIIGDGPELKKLELQVAGCNLQACVKFLGEIPHEEIPQYLWRADIFVRPSRSEGMGNSFVEALAAGLPILGTPVGGIPDIIENEKTGLFARVDDSRDLAEKIIRLLGDDNIARVIVENGKKMVEDRFSWDVIAGSYAKIFERHTEHRTLKILITTGLFPPEVGGPATYSKVLLEELPKRGIQVDVLPFREVRRLPKVIRHLAYFLKIVLRAKGVDIIFAQDPISVGLPAALAAKILRKKFLLKIVGDYAWEQGVQRFGVRELLDDFLNKKYGFRVRILRKLERYVALTAEVILVPSHYVGGVVEKWGLSPQKIRAVYNSFDSQEKIISKEEAKKLLGVNGYIVVSAGRFVPWKGFNMLIEILPELLVEIPNLRLFIIGSGPEDKALKDKAKSLKINDSVTFLENLSHEKFLLYLRAADSFLLNTAYEGLPHTVLEAMSMETPVITTAIGGNTEVIENGISGILVEYNNRKELKEAVVMVWRDRGLARNLAEGAKRKLGDFRRDKIMEETVNLLRSI